MRGQFITRCTLLSAFILLFYRQAIGQANPMEPQAAITALENGTLVFRLNTSTKKIATLEKMVASATNEKDRLRFEKLTVDTKIAARSENVGLIAAFRTHYNFSKIVFMPDTATAAFKAGMRQGIFVNDSLEIDTSIQLEGDYLVAYYGASTSDETTSNEGITVLDPNLLRLESPFPYFTGRTSVRRMFQEEFKKMTQQDHYNILVGKFQRALMEF